MTHRISATATAILPHMTASTRNDRRLAQRIWWRGICRRHERMDQGPWTGHFPHLDLDQCGTARNFRRLERLAESRRRIHPFGPHAKGFRQELEVRILQVGGKGAAKI